MGPISIRLEAEVKEALQELAEADERSLSSVPEGEHVTTVARRFPDLTCPEFMAALQDATAAAERKVLRPH